MEELKACPYCEDYEGMACEGKDGNVQMFNFCPICGNPLTTTGRKILANRRAKPENKALTLENEELKSRFAGSGEKSEYIKVPNNLSRELLIKEFGISAVEWYESYLADRISLGKTYLNPQKTIYLWATRDRKTGQGWFSRLPRQYDGHKSKGHGGS